MSFHHSTSTDQAIPRLTRRSPHSFDCSDIVSFTAWLQSNGFTQVERSRSLVEHSRWLRSGRIVICYQSGAIVCQGIQPEAAITLLATLVNERTPLELAVR